MNRYTFGDLLPLAGAGAPLLIAAVGAPYPMTLTNLAKRAGISKFAASRAAAALAEVGLMVRDEDGYAFNDSHPLGETVVELSWRFSGVRRAGTGERRGRGGRPGDDFHYRHTVPESLQRGMEHAPNTAALDGPDLVTARDTCTWLLRQQPHLQGFEADGRAVYALWSNERLRDLIHQTLHLGAAVGAAFETLSAACGADAQGEADPARVNVSGLAWVRATYLVSAETRELLRVIGLLDQAVWVGGSVNQLRSKALSSVHTMNYVGRDSLFFERHRDEAMANENMAMALWDDSTYGPWRNVGGTPRPEDVGTAGDQIMAVRLLRAAKAMAAQVAAMSGHECVTGWAGHHPQEAAALPLVDHIPDEALSGRSDRPILGGGAEPPHA